VQPTGGVSETAGGIGTGAGGIWTAKGAPLLSTQTFGRTKDLPGMYCEETPPAPTDGRPPLDEKSNRKSVPVRTVNGRPEASSMIGETVKLPKNFLAKPSPECDSGVWKRR